MKRGTDMKLKFKRLCKSLHLEAWQAKGLLQAIWDFTAENAPLGNIGRFTDEEIALGIDYGGDPKELIDALSKGWLDRHLTHRLIVHDWAEHAEDWVLKRAGRVLGLENGKRASADEIRAALDAPRAESPAQRAETDAHGPDFGALPDPDPDPVTRSITDPDPVTRSRSGARAHSAARSASDSGSVGNILEEMKPDWYVAEVVRVTGDESFRKRGHTRSITDVLKHPRGPDYLETLLEKVEKECDKTLAEARGSTKIENPAGFVTHAIRKFLEKPEEAKL